MTSSTPRHTNALAREASPYLLQHAHNPVDWHPWGDDAFNLARQRDVPIFLSIGYSTCYWCHVMERQCFENEAIAAIMNEHFVCIKADREERPDVDDLYMTATQLMTRRGGWPMSVFLTPDDLLPFWCGTYIPPEPAHGMASFPQVLRGIDEAWRQRRDDILQQARRVADAVRDTLDRRDLAGPLALDLVSGAAGQLLRSYDPEHGGFGGAPKFPQPSNLLFLLAVHRNNPDAGVWPPLAHTLDRMARGGMYDQIGGGFHRYSTDDKWLVPHFEKMLYDQGQLLEAYVQAHAIRPPEDDPTFYTDVVRHTADYLLREMTDPQGGLWSAQDAEVEAREGGNYVWTAAEVRQVLADTDLSELALAYYGLDAGPNFRDPHHADAEPVNVLHVPVPPAEFAAARGLPLDVLLTKVQQVDALLLAVRDRRKQPGTDDKVIVAWNGLAIAGLAAAGRALGDARYTDAAARAADFVLAHLWGADGSLQRTWRRGTTGKAAVLEDYALLAHGLIALHRATGEGGPLQQAVEVLRAAIARFAADGGGYFGTLADQSDLFVRSRALHDGAIPSANSVMVHNLIDLFEMTGQRDWLDRAVRDLRGVGAALRDKGVGMVHMQHALLRAAQHDPAILGGPSEPPTSHLVQARYDAPHLTLEIAAGHHVAASELTVSGYGCTVEADLPPPVEKRYPYADAPVPVYEGRVTWRVVVRDITHSEAHLQVRYQACTDSACLAPQTLAVPVPALPGG